MSRVIISEFAAKKLFTDSVYQGISVAPDTDLSSLALQQGLYVVKVDDGTKKRNKKGLVAVGVPAADVLPKVQDFLKAGYVKVLVEPFVEHEKSAERYISLNIVREGAEVLYGDSGGNEVEEHGEDVLKTVVSLENFLTGIVPVVDSIVPAVLEKMLVFMKNNNVSFLEINPFILDGDTIVCLDMAVEVDSTKLHSLPTWIGTHIQNSRNMSEAERAVQKLDVESTATFSLTVFDKDASVFTLLSGGGASLVVIDELVTSGMQAAVGNYGEYSGAPTREETARYTRELLALLFASKAEKKVLLIAGGVANFTDVATTFAGVIDACTEYLGEFAAQSVMVRVRRGGPRQAEGLAQLETFFANHAIPALVSGPDVTLSEAVADVCNFLKS